MVIPKLPELQERSGTAPGQGWDFGELSHAKMILVVSEEQSDPCGPSGAVPVPRAVLSPAVSPGLVPTTRSR